MKKKICLSFLMILIVVGIAMSVLNFSTKAYASREDGPGGRDSIWGTTWRLTTWLPRSIAEREGRHLFRDYYCIDDARNCVIVF